MRLIEINLTLATDNPAAALDAYEIVGRLAAGYGLDGFHAETSFDRVTIDDWADDDQHDQALADTDDT